MGMSRQEHDTPKMAAAQFKAHCLAVIDFFADLRLRRIIPPLTPVDRLMHCLQGKACMLRYA